MADWKTPLRRPWIGISLGLLTLGIRLAGLVWAEAIWNAYFPLYAALRWLQQALWGWVPFPLVYLWLPGVLGYVGWRLVRRVRTRAQRKGEPVLRRRMRDLRRLANLGGAAFFLFHILWGFNYLHNPLASRLPAQYPALDAEELCLEAEWTLRNAELARARIPGIGRDSMPAALLPADYRAQVASALTGLLDSLGLPQARAATGREIHPHGFLLRMGIGGIYNPFTGEGNIDAALITPLKPEVVAHEMTHGKGYTDEGTCNFLGMWACMAADDPALQYSGHLAYYLYLAGDLYQADPQMQQMVRVSVDSTVRTDLRAYRNTARRYRGWLSRVGQSVNHAYLSTQGVAGGITNYDKVVAYMASFRVSRSLGRQRRAP